jgi:hypothetical protein
MRGPNVVTHFYNPSYSGDWEDYSPRPYWRKTYQDPISTNKLVVVVVSMMLAMWEAKVGLWSIGGPRQKCKTLSEK